jgi:hypothetical protein
MMTLIREWGARLLLMLGGVALAAGIIVLAAPVLLPEGNARMANVDMGEVTFTVGMGDLFIAQSGSIEPPPNPEAILSQHSLAWTEDGFRVPAWIADIYPVVALGDSYTEATNVAMPWPDVLAQAYQQPVKNLGFRGYGPQEEARIMEEYGVEYAPEVVVIGFFGGNDISNAGSYRWRADNFVLPELMEQVAVEYDASGEPWQSDNESYQYPVELDLNGQTVPVAFFNSYVSWLNITRDDLLKSYNVRAVRESWQRVRDAAGDETCVLIAYFPSKPHIYLPYVVPEDRNAIIDGQVQRAVEMGGGTIEKRSVQPTWEELLERRHNMPAVLGEIASNEGYQFVDLTPHFTDAADAGELLYYTYDTHWNQAGHDLAGEIIADAVRQQCDA